MSCYIKDASCFLSISHIRETLAAHRVPQSCAGCREIFRPVALTAGAHVKNT